MNTKANTQQTPTPSASAPPIKLPPPIDVLGAFENDPPELDFVLPNFLAGTTGGIVSPGGTGKSMLTLAICAQIAGQDAGIPDMLGCGEVKGGQVAYLPAEDPQDVVATRMHAIGTHLTPEQRQCIADRLLIQPLIGRLPDIMSTDWQDTLAWIADGRRLVIIDTLRRFHRADENDSGAMATIMGRLEQVADRTGCAVAFAHHVSKGSALLGTGDQQQASRGSSVIADHARWQAYLSGMTRKEADVLGVPQDERRWYVRAGTCKANYGAPTPDRWLRRLDGGVLWHADWLAADARKDARKSSSSTSKKYKPWVRHEQEHDDDW